MHEELKVSENGLGLCPLKNCIEARHFTLESDIWSVLVAQLTFPF